MPFHRSHREFFHVLVILVRLDKGVVEFWFSRTGKVFDRQGSASNRIPEHVPNPKL